MCCSGDATDASPALLMGCSRALTADAKERAVSAWWVSEGIRCRVSSSRGECLRGGVGSRVIASEVNGGKGSRVGHKRGEVNVSS